MRSVSGEAGALFAEIFVSGFASSIKFPLPLSALISEREKKKTSFALLRPSGLIEGETVRKETRNKVVSHHIWLTRTVRVFTGMEP